MKTMKGGEPSVDWDALAPHIAHETREAIVEAIRWVGEPLSAADLRAILADPKLSISNLSYHAKTMVDENVLDGADERIRGVSTERLYFFPHRP